MGSGGLDAGAQTEAVAVGPGVAASDELVDPSSETLTSEGRIYWWGFDGEIYESRYAIIDGLVFVQPDVAIGTVEQALADHRQIARAMDDETELKALLDVRGRHKWKNNRIRYQIDGDFDATEEGQIRNAINEWNRHSHLTGLEWDEVHDLDRRESGVFFKKKSFGARSDSCFTNRTGRHPRRTEIVLGADDGCTRPETVAHEMGHAMGLHHEHQRDDRNRWIRVIEDNSTKGAVASWFDVRQKSLPRRHRKIGSYDHESVMHYETDRGQRIAGLRMPVFLNREVLSLYGGAPASPSVLALQQQWNRFVRLGQRGIELHGVHVLDVDGDGFDDLVTSTEDGLFWSRSAASGWIPLEPGGQPVTAPLHRVALGELDDDTGIDALVISSSGRVSVWELISSDGTVSRRARPGVVVDIEVAKLDEDTLDDVFVVMGGGSWRIAHGGDVLGLLDTHVAGDMGVDDVELVRLGGTADGVHVVGFPDKVLSHVAPDDSTWSPILASGDNGPLPGRARRLDPLTEEEVEHLPLLAASESLPWRVWFGHVDDPAAPGEPMDLVTVSNGSDGSGARKGMPVFVPDVLGASPTTMTNFGYAGGADSPVDARLEALLGRFQHNDLASFVTLGFIPDGFVTTGDPSPRGNRPLHPAPSDIGALGQRYLDSAPIILTDRYPLALGRDVNTNVFDVVEPHERIEIEGDFMSPSGISLVEIETTRIGFDRQVVGTEFRPVVGKVAEARTVFQQRDPGVYRVQMTTPPGAKVTWVFRVRGELCGDGFRDGLVPSRYLDPGKWEECDHGTDNSDTAADACRLDCELAHCGDGVVDTGEDCDDGNTTDGDGCPSDCGSVACGNGVVDSGEECDDGGESMNCDADCTFAECGDGLKNETAGEQCDDGNTVSNDGCDSTCKVELF